MSVLKAMICERVNTDHEQGVIDRGGQIQVSEMSRASERREVAGSAAVASRLRRSDNRYYGILDGKGRSRPREESRETSKRTRYSQIPRFTRSQRRIIQSTLVRSIQVIQQRRIRDPQHP